MEVGNTYIYFKSFICIVLQGLAKKKNLSYYTQKFKARNFHAFIVVVDYHSPAFEAQHDQTIPEIFTYMTFLLYTKWSWVISSRKLHFSFRFRTLL